MKIKCIKIPDELHSCRSVTIGKIYSVIDKDDHDYLIIDDNSDEYYYQLECFEELE